VVRDIAESNVGRCMCGVFPELPLSAAADKHPSRNQSVTRQHALIFPPAYPVTPRAVVSSVAACCLRPTTHALLCTVNGDDSAVFRFLSMVIVTLAFELRRDFCTAYLTAKFDHRMFSRSEVIVRTNTLTH